MPQPYQTLNDLPRGAWFRPLPPPEELDVPTFQNQVGWMQIYKVYTQSKTVSLPFYPNVFSLADLSSGWEYTNDPFRDNPIVFPCLVGADTGDKL